MTTFDCIADLPLPPGDGRQSLLYARLLLCYLADHVYSAEPQLRDATDFRNWLRDLSDEVRKLSQAKEAA
jgi:hypothetical protein